jgi:hypothetical protein
MKKRTTFTILFVTGLLVLAFISGSVFAQGDISSSDNSGAVAEPSYSREEAAPGNSSSADGEMASSASDVTSINNTSQYVDESTFHVSVPGMSSSSDSQSDVPIGGGIKFDPLLALETKNPNAPTWNSTLRFVGSTLRPRRNDVNYTTNSNGGCVYVESGNASTIWNLPLALPNGTKVEWLRMYYYDNDPAVTMNGWFTKYDLYGSIVQEWSMSSVDGGNMYTDVLITPTQTIDYGAFSYVINWRPVGTGANLQLCGFRIFYTTMGFNFIPWISKH